MRLPQLRLQKTSRRASTQARGLPSMGQGCRRDSPWGHCPVEPWGRVRSPLTPHKCISRCAIPDEPESYNSGFFRNSHWGGPPKSWGPTCSPGMSITWGLEPRRIVLKPWGLISFTQLDLGLILDLLTSFFWSFMPPFWKGNVYSVPLPPLSLGSTEWFVWFHRFPAGDQPALGWTCIKSPSYLIWVIDETGLRLWFDPGTR